MSLSKPTEIAKKIIRSFTAYAYKRSYSQCGEDLIVRYIFNVLKVHKPTYLDIGAHHPLHLNNTYTFYRHGSKGVSVEPDPKLHARIQRKRPGDVNLNVGVAGESGTLDFYVMSAPTLNTFSLKEAKEAESSKVKIDKVLRIPVVSVNEILEQHFPNAAPDFLSIDVEGMDFEIVKSIELKRWRPKVICAETLSYSELTGGEKLNEIHQYLEGHGYRVYADTYINTIFIDRDVW